MKKPRGREARERLFLLFFGLRQTLSSDGPVDLILSRIICIDESWKAVALGEKDSHICQDSET
jgi:hypothetical protein